jgi:DtxR family Mn-dependent transcriptional regulator
MVAQAAHNLSESLEDYLEAIYHLERASRVARAADIASRLGVSRPSVTGALRLLKQKDLISYDPYSYVTLTPQGKRAATDVVRRHTILKDFLENVLSLPPEKANHAACRMEHVLEPEVMARFLDFARFVEACPRGGGEWIRGFGFTCQDKGRFPECARCVNAAHADHSARTGKLRLTSADSNS